jgi:CelD/BcsL family acetyltransferase involved in cellulose biosynthesis
LLEGPLRCDLLWVGPIELDTPGHRGFLEGLRRHAHFVEIKPLERPIVCHSLPADFETYQEKVMGRGLVKEVQYKVRRLHRDGDTSIRHYHNPSGEELEAVLRDCQLVEGRSWLAAVDDARLRFATERDLQFWRQLVANGLPQDGGLDVWMLHFSNQPASYCLTVTAGGIRYGISSQYDRDYHKYSTGSVLFYHVFEDACNSGVQSVHFGPGSLQYKGRWGGVEEGECVEALVFPPGLKGRCLAALYKQLKRLRPRWVKPK